MSEDGSDRFEDRSRGEGALRSIGDVPADPTFRTALRERFVRGALEERPKPVQRRGALAAVALAAAALGAAVVVFFVANPSAPAWRLVSASGPGEIRVDDRVFSATSLAELAPFLEAGARVRTGRDTELTVAAEGVLLVVTGASGATLPALRGRFFDAGLEGAIETGEVRVTTGAGFSEHGLAIFSPEAIVAVSGTTLAVIRDEAGTCVCVLEGSVQMRQVSPARAGAVAVEAGTRRYALRDGALSAVEEIRPMERGKLEMLEQQGRREIAPGATAAAARAPVAPR